MLGFVVFGSRTWMWTTAAPALAASMQEFAICSGVTGTAGFLPGESADPVTAQEIITFRCIPLLLHRRSQRFFPGIHSLPQDCMATVTRIPYAELASCRPSKSTCGVLAMQSPMMIDCPSAMVPHLQKIANGEYEIPYEHPNPVILDLGANVGGFAAWASQRWPRSVIHCY